MGSTKTGSMLTFENFYGPMGNGKLVGDAYVDWWSGFVPTLRSPHDNESFDHYPRLTTFQWDPVPASGATYNVEIDATWLVSGALSECSYEHMFVGAQRGRWRVRANVHGRAWRWRWSSPAPPCC